MIQQQDAFEDSSPEAVAAFHSCLDNITRFIPAELDYFAEMPLEGMDAYEVAFSYQGNDADDGQFSEQQLCKVVAAIPLDLFDFELQHSPQTDVPILYVSRILLEVR